MQRVDPDGALKMYMQSGEWEKCLQLAKELVKHNIIKSTLCTLDIMHIHLDIHIQFLQYMYMYVLVCVQSWLQWFIC